MSRRPAVDPQLESVSAIERGPDLQDITQAIGLKAAELVASGGYSGGGAVFASQYRIRGNEVLEWARDDGFALGSARRIGKVCADGVDTDLAVLGDEYDYLKKWTPQSMLAYKEVCKALLDGHSKLPADSKGAEFVRQSFADLSRQQTQYSEQEVLDPKLEVLKRHLADSGRDGKQSFDNAEAVAAAIGFQVEVVAQPAEQPARPPKVPARTFRVTLLSNAKKTAAIAVVGGIGITVAGQSASALESSQPQEPLIVATASPVSTASAEEIAPQVLASDGSIAPATPKPIAATVHTTEGPITLTPSAAVEKRVLSSVAQAPAEPAPAPAAVATADTLPTHATAYTVWAPISAADYVRSQVAATEVRLSSYTPKDPQAFHAALDLAETLVDNPNVSLTGPDIKPLVTRVAAAADANRVLTDNAANPIEADLTAADGSANQLPADPQSLAAAALAVANVELDPDAVTAQAVSDTNGSFDDFSQGAVAPAAYTVAAKHHDRAAAATHHAKTSGHTGEHAHNQEKMPRRQAIIQGLVDYGVPRKYAKLFVKYGKKYDLSPAFLAAQDKEESGFLDKYVYGRQKSSAGAVGVAQFMEGTWESWKRELGFPAYAEPTMPRFAIHAQAAMMHSLKKQAAVHPSFGNPEHVALSAYNTGFGNVRKYHGIPSYTDSYVDNIESMRGAMQVRINHRLAEARGHHESSKVGGETHGVPNDFSERVVFYAKELGIKNSQIRTFVSSAGIVHFQIARSAWSQSDKLRRAMPLINKYIDINGGIESGNEWQLSTVRKIDSSIDAWRVYALQCVDLGSFAVANDKYPGGMPSFNTGGIGSGTADQWPAAARAEHVPINHHLATGSIIDWNQNGKEHTWKGHVAYDVYGAGNWAVYLEANFDGKGSVDMQIMSPQNMELNWNQIRVLQYEKGKQGPGIDSVQPARHHRHGGGHKGATPPKPKAPQPVANPTPPPVVITPGPVAPVAPTGGDGSTQGTGAGQGTGNTDPGTPSSGTDSPGQQASGGDTAPSGPTVITPDTAVTLP